LVAEGIDLAVRAGPLADTSYAMRLLAEVRLRSIASPTHLREHGEPRNIGDLGAHRSPALAWRRGRQRLVHARERGRAPGAPVNRQLGCARIDVREISQSRQGVRA
jgi:hypothetical protein